MKLIASGIDRLPRGITRAFVVQPADIPTIPATGSPIVIVDREAGGSNVLYEPRTVWENGKNRDRTATEVEEAWDHMTLDIALVMEINPRARVACWSVPRAEDTIVFDDCDDKNRFAWPVMAHCDFACLNCYLSGEVDASCWVKGCCNLARVFGKPIICGTSPLFMYDDNFLKPISEDRLAQHYRDIKAAGADYLLHWGEWKQVMSVGLSRVVNNDIDAVIVAAFDKHHADKTGWTQEQLSEWMDVVDQRCLKIAKGVAA